MDLLDVIILLLRVVLVALLYVFLALVIRLAARGLQPTRQLTAPSHAPTGSGELRLVVLDPGNSELRAGQIVEMPDGATLGRSARAEVVIADSSVSAEHARVFRVGRAWVVTDLGSTNGTQVNQTAVNGEMPLAPNDVLALGSVRLKVVAR